jgi:Fe-Mn family superoxide dismutase
MFQLPDLSYDFDALEKSIDAKTMEIHHDKHHAAYVNNLNKALENAGEKWQDKQLDWLLRNLNELPEDQRGAVRNNGGGHYNHSLFWTVLSPSGGGKPSGDLAAAIDKTFGSFDKFKTEFATAAGTRFGSGWAWLTVENNKLRVLSTANQDNPLTEGAGVPILGLDVWEHAYYLRYQNRRPDYVQAAWDLFDWKEVARRYRETCKGC